MNSMQRIVMAMNHQEPDCVPVYPILSGATRRLTGVSYKEWATNVDVCEKVRLKAKDEFGYDCIVTLVDLSIECDD